MNHLLIGYQLLLVIIGFLTLVFLFLAREKKSYFRALFGFYIIFYGILFLTFIRAYVQINITMASAYVVYLSHGITTVLNYMLLIFAIRTAHKLRGLERAAVEKIWIVSLVLSAMLMISPLSLSYIEETASMSLHGPFYAASVSYVGALAYLAFIFLSRISVLSDTKDRITALLLGLLSLSGFIETVSSIVEDLKYPIYEIDMGSGGTLASSLPFLLFSLYIIYMTARLIVGAESREPTEEELKASGFSPREIEVIGQILKGHSNQKIADDLCISLATVKTHINNIFRKSEVSNRFELAKKLEK